MKGLKKLNKKELISINAGESGWYYLGKFFRAYADMMAEMGKGTRSGGRFH